MNLTHEKKKIPNNALKDKSVRLYLKVHVMPKLNMPLKGKTYYWVAPVVIIALGVVAYFYFFSN